MKPVLCIETTTTNCSVAIGDSEGLIDFKEINSKNYSHAEQLHVFIQEVLKNNNLSLSDLSAIAVSKGPGSYTGLRIGVSAAKGLCYASDLPLVAIDTLQSLAYQSDFDLYTYVVPLLDARRMDVYSAVFDKDGHKRSPTEAVTLDDSSYKEQLNQGTVLFIGNATEKWQNSCSHPNAEFQFTYPSAKEMIALAIEKIARKDFENLAYFEPYYLKDFVAKKPKKRS